MRLTWFAIDAVPCMRFTIYPRLPAIFFLATRKMIIIVVTVFVVALCATRFFSPIIQVHCQCQWVWFNPFVHRTRALTSYERSLTRLFHFPHLKYRTLILFNRSIAWYDWGKNPKKKIECNLIVLSPMKRDKNSTYKCSGWKKIRVILTHIIHRDTACDSICNYVQTRRYEYMYCCFRFSSMEIRMFFHHLFTILVWKSSILYLQFHEIDGNRSINRAFNWHRNKEI